MIRLLFKIVDVRILVFTKISYHRTSSTIDWNQLLSK